MSGLAPTHSGRPVHALRAHIPCSTRTDHAVSPPWREARRSRAEPAGRGHDVAQSRLIARFFSHVHAKHPYHPLIHPPHIPPPRPLRRTWGAASRSSLLPWRAPLSTAAVRLHSAVVPDSAVRPQRLRKKQRWRRLTNARHPKRRASKRHPEKDIIPAHTEGAPRSGLQKTAKSSHQPVAVLLSHSPNSRGCRRPGGSSHPLISESVYLSAAAYLKPAPGPRVLATHAIGRGAPACRAECWDMISVCRRGASPASHRKLRVAAALSTASASTWALSITADGHPAAKTLWPWAAKPLPTARARTSALRVAQRALIAGVCRRARCGRGRSHGAAPSPA